MKIALLHRHEPKDIKRTNAAFPYLVEKGMDVLTFKKFGRFKRIKSFLWIFYAPLLVWRKGYDVIYCDDSMPFYAGLVKLASPQSRVVLRLGDFHLMYYPRLYKWLHWIEQWSWRKVDRIIAISETMAKFIRGKVKTPVNVILDPVDPEDFKCDEELKKNRKIVMFHGQLTKNKGLDVLLEAARRMPDIDFVIIGDGPEFMRLFNLGGDNVFMPGWIPFEKMKYHIHMADVGVAIRSKNPGNEFIVTSPWLQYLVMGKPCIVSKRKVFDDIGYPHQFESVDELGVSIRYVLDYKERAIRCSFFNKKTWQDYILKNHNAKKIAYQIWQILIIGKIT